METINWFDKDKYERQKVLDIFGLNTPDNRFVPNEQALRRIDLLEHPGWSIRCSRRENQHYSEDKIMKGLKERIPSKLRGHLDGGFLPHLFDYPTDFVLTILEYLLDVNLDIIIMPGINIADCEFAGAIWKLGRQQMIVEIIDGPYSVREVTVKGNISRRFDWPNKPVSSPIRRAIYQIQQLPFNDVIFEFSHYHKEIGKRNDTLIFWDYLSAKQYGTKSLIHAILQK